VFLAADDTRRSKLSLVPKETEIVVKSGEIPISRFSFAEMIRAAMMPNHTRLRPAEALGGASQTK
jgi:hypothetical protein